MDMLAFVAMSMESCYSPRSYKGSIGICCFYSSYLNGTLRLENEKTIYLAKIRLELGFLSLHGYSMLL